MISISRINAFILRHIYLIRSSWPRIIEMIYWPTVQMILWAFITLFLATKSSWVAQGAGVLISAVLLWDVLFRSQLGVSLTFIEEVWSRNLGYLFTSPLRPQELVIGMLIISMIRTLIGVGGASLIAIAMFDHSIYDLGLPLAGFFTNLIIMGWSIGLVVSGIIMRYGLGAESLAWIAVFAIQPVSGVYYPIATLPDWLQSVAWFLPSSHVFEGLRAIMFEQTFLADHLITAFSLNLFYLSICSALFIWFFEKARQAGQLLQAGE
ncbi:MAG TPA: ABC transporter [Gammaproteobacteria bacterium]|nr:ABC transporter [Gammaproteobacteria bacterium]